MSILQHTHQDQPQHDLPNHSYAFHECVSIHEIIAGKTSVGKVAKEDRVKGMAPTPTHRILIKVRRARIYSYYKYHRNQNQIMKTLRLPVPIQLVQYIYPPTDYGREAWELLQKYNIGVSNSLLIKPSILELISPPQKLFTHNCQMAVR